MSDLLTPLPDIAEDKLHWAFKLLIDEEKYAPARDMLRKLWAAFPSPDDHFIREFQTAGFDARVWELVLAAIGVFGPYEISRPYDAPDFLFERDGLRVWIEATTANPSTKPPQNIEGIDDEVEAKFHELNNVIPIRLGSPLYSKLKKASWNQPHVAGQPFVIAIEDFADPFPVRMGDAALFRYLYGMDHKTIGSMNAVSPPLRASLVNGIPLIRRPAQPGRTTRAGRRREPTCGSTRSAPLSWAPMGRRPAKWTCSSGLPVSAARGTSLRTALTR